jgi:hypothetical protein
LVVIAWAAVVLPPGAGNVISHRRRARLHPAGATLELCRGGARPSSPGTGE